MKHRKNFCTRFKTKGMEGSVRALCYIMTTHDLILLVALRTLLKNWEFGWEQFNHPQYSPNIASSDFDLFLNFVRDFGGRSFDSDEELKNGIHQWLFSQTAFFLWRRKRKIYFPFDECLNNDGNYFKNSLRDTYYCKINFSEKKICFYNFFVNSI